MTTSRPASDPALPAVPRYSWYALGVLALTYCLNFIDKQILSILAEDIKRDLGLSDGDLGFLYGTAFAVFYTLFGIPMGRLADNVSRTRLLSLGLAAWSCLTALSGFAQNGVQLAAARFGVGIGEATAAPTAYSLISDYFPPSRRATALALYAGGLYIGAGLSLFLGGALVETWNALYPDGGPLGLVGWQAAFMACGAPGLILAVWVATLREPPRDKGDDATPRAGAFRLFFTETAEVVPPFTFIGAFRRGYPSVWQSVMVAALIAGVATILIRSFGDIMQWTILGIAFFGVWNWARALGERDPHTFSKIWGSRPFMFVALGYAFIAWTSYSFSFWCIPYAVRTFGISLSEAGLIIGGTSAVAGASGALFGGMIADRLQRRDPAGRLWVAFFAAVVPPPLIVVAFTTDSLVVFYLLQFPISAIIAMALGPCAATIQELVLPRMRGTASAVFYTGLTLIGLAMGPYIVGRVSEWSGNLATGIIGNQIVCLIAALCLWNAIRILRRSGQ